MKRRRTLGSEKQANAFEPFYSDFPELTEKGLYQLISQSMKTDMINLYAEFGDEIYTYIGGMRKNATLTVVILDDYSVIYLNGVKDGDGINLIFRKSSTHKGVKLKACVGGKNDAPQVEYYVEKIL